MKRVLWCFVCLFPSHCLASNSNTLKNPNPLNTPQTPPHTPQPILSTLAAALAAYSRRNLRILYDAISTLAEAVRPALQAPEYSLLLMPPLLAKWNALGDDDPELLPLLECFTAVAVTLGMCGGGGG